MDRLILDDILTFVGLMTVLGVAMKFAYALINRHKGLPDSHVAKALDDISRRLTQLEQAVDTTALEVERIAEGQRFTTKLLADKERTPS